MLARASVLLLLFCCFAADASAGRTTSQGRGATRATATKAKKSIKRAAHAKAKAHRRPHARSGPSQTGWVAKFKPKTAKAVAGERTTIKNRGRLATLEGIYVGKKYSLRNPSNGHLDRKATVVEAGHEALGGIPYAYVKFANGHEELYAAERLHLVGKGLKFQREYMEGAANRIDNAILKELKISDPSIRAVTLRGRMRMPPADKHNTPVHLGPFLKGLGEQLAPGEGLTGYYFGGRYTYVSRMYSGFDYVTRVHEKLHGMTNPFSDQALKKDLTNMLEGMTDYFTYKVTTPHFGIEPDKAHPYYPYVEFAENVAGKIGQEKMHKLFFGEGKGLVAKMAREVDKAVGERGAFYKAARNLELGLPVDL